MGKYMFHANYTQAGLGGLLKEGILTVRVTALVAPETVDEAAGKTVPYRVPRA